MARDRKKQGEVDRITMNEPAEFAGPGVEGKKTIDPAAERDHFIITRRAEKTVKVWFDGYGKEIACEPA